MRRYYKSGGKICPKGKAWAKRTFDTYPSAYANMAASKYCKAQSLSQGQRASTAKKKKKEGGQGKTVVKNTPDAEVKLRSGGLARRRRHHKGCGAVMDVRRKKTLYV